MPGIQPIADDGVRRYNLNYMTDSWHIDPLKHLEQQRAAAWKELQHREPELARQIEKWDQAIHALRGTGEYSIYRSGADAMVVYLQIHGPSDRATACRAVTDGGWANGHRDAYWKLWDAISYQIEECATPKVVSLGDDMIGLPEHKAAKKSNRRK